MATPSIFDIGLAESTFFELYQSQGYDNLLIALKVAQDNIIAKIEKIKGDTWTKRQQQTILKQINIEIGNAYRGLFAEMQTESVGISEITFNALLGTVSQKIPLAAVKDLQNSKRVIQMGSDLTIGDKVVKAKKKNYTFQSLFKLSEKNHAKQLRTLISVGVTQGLTSKQIVKEFDIKNNQLSKGQVTSNIFTVIADSRNQGNYLAYAELENTGVVEYYEHSSVLDSHTSIHICVPRDGRKYYQKIKNISSFNKPPLHGNCRSKLLAKTKNQTIPKTNYPDWFKKQDNQFQKSVLGAKKYNAYKNGSFKITTLADVKGRKMSLKTIKSNLDSYSKGK